MHQDHCNQPSTLFDQQETGRIIEKIFPLLSVIVDSILLMSCPSLYGNDAEKYTLLTAHNLILIGWIDLYPVHLFSVANAALSMWLHHRE